MRKQKSILATLLLLIAAIATGLLLRNWFDKTLDIALHDSYLVIDFSSLIIPIVITFSFLLKALISKPQRKTSLILVVITISYTILVLLLMFFGMYNTISR